MMVVTCFPEPTGPEPDTATGADFLDRSTSKQARELRASLNDLLDAMPSDIAASFCHRLRVDSLPAVWFELFVGPYLQLAGANVGYGPIGANGASPDWQATFPGGHVLYVEATSPEYDPALDRVRANHEPLRAIIHVAIPERWSYSIRRLPNHRPHHRRV